MARSTNLTNKLGRSLRGNKLVFNLPEPTTIVSRESCLDNRENKIRLALSKMVKGEVKAVENVHVERIQYRNSTPFFIVNYSDCYNTDEAIARICRIIDNRKRTS